MISKNIRAFGGPGRYIQGIGEIDNLVIYTSIYGNSPYLIIDEYFYDTYSKKFTDLYSNTGIKVYFKKFENQITKEKIDNTIKEALDLNVNVIVGIGGGKALDLAKDVADSLSDMPLIIVPTIAASDAPCSAVSIIYNDDGQTIAANFHKSNPDMVIVDTRIISKAPVRFLVAGMGDALATYYEARANIESNNPNYINAKYGNGYKRTLLGTAVAKCCYDTIITDGIKAKMAVETGVVTEALENVVEANILLSGIGFENMACAGAHSIGTGLGFVKSSRGMLHGEKVAYGILCQLNIENRRLEEIEDLMRFYCNVGLPLTLEDLGLDSSEETIKTIAFGSYEQDWKSEPCVITPEIICDGIKVTEYIGNKFKGKYSFSKNDDIKVW